MVITCKYRRRVDGIYFSYPCSENLTSWMARRRNSNESYVIYFLLFIYGIVNGTVSNSDLIASKDRTISD
jgi:hypothetical protein